MVITIVQWHLRNLATISFYIMSIICFCYAVIEIVIERSESIEAAADLELI